MQTSKFNELMQKEMSRQEFLQYVGIALLGIVGITGLIANIEKHFGQTQRSSGYGATPYGK